MWTWDVHFSEVNQRVLVGFREGDTSRIQGGTLAGKGGDEGKKEEGVKGRLWGRAGL